LEDMTATAASNRSKKCWGRRPHFLFGRHEAKGSINTSASVWNAVAVIISIYYRVLKKRRRIHMCIVLSALG